MIVYFGSFGAHNFERLWQRDQEIACRLQAVEPVAYVEWTGPRVIPYLGQLFRRLLTPRKRRPGELAFVFPVQVPGSLGARMTAANAWLLERQVRHRVGEPSEPSTVIWAEMPSHICLALASRTKWPVVYDRMGKLQDTGYESSVRSADRLLAQRAALLVTDSLWFQRAMAAEGLSSVYIPQGVAEEWIHRAGSREPDRLARSERVHLCYLGSWHRALDSRLLESLLAASEDWDLTLVGPSTQELPDSLAMHPRVTATGRVAHADIPDILRGVDVGLVPYVENQLTQSVFPTKLYEYIALGIPVATTALPSVEPVRDCIWCAGPGLSFPSAVRAAAGAWSVGQVDARLALARANTWEARMRDVVTALCQVR